MLTKTLFRVADKKHHRFIRILSLYLIFHSSWTLAYEPTPRRIEQYPTEFAYMVVPLPYSMPGIGEGFFVMANILNLFDTTLDTTIVRVTGDASGLFGQVDEIPVIKNRLLLTVTDMDISKATVNDYKTRGMNSTKDDFNVLEISGVRQQNARLALHFWQRRIVLNARYERFQSQVSAIRDADGNIIASYSDPNTSKNSQLSYGAQFDMTDNFLDPRDGYHLEFLYSNHKASDQDDSDFYVLDYKLQYYLPMFKDDTLAFNYHRSEAHVSRIGEIDPAAIRASLNTNCDPLDTACLDAEDQLVQNTIDQRRFGTAMPLGGSERLRSYPGSRYSGGHMAFVGVEYRANFGREAKPFDYFIWKDIRTNLQVAVFAEAGTVAETSGGLWDEVRTSYGIGARLLSASGSVYRADLATGSEGTEITIFFFYPWRL